MNSKARSLLLRFGLGLLTLLLTIAALWMLSRALYPTDRQLAAVALMQSNDAPPGRNAFPAVWTLERAVPEGEMAEVVRRDAHMLDQQPVIGGSDEPFEFESSAQDYPGLVPSVADQGLFCQSSSPGCIQRVRADLQSYRELVDRNRELLDRGEALFDYDYLHNLLPPRMAGPLPAFGSSRYLPTRHALWFVEGQTDRALAASCNAIRGWRRLAASSDMLLSQLIGQAYATRLHGAVLAEMLTELPLDHTLPSACASALVTPQPQELSLCSAMRGEYALSASIMQAVETNARVSETGITAFMSRFFYSARATNAENAEFMARSCSDEALQEIASDSPQADPPEPLGVLRLACLGNFIGCLLNGIAAPAWSSYRLQTQDYGARLSLLGTLLEARTRPGDDPATAAARVRQRLAKLSNRQRDYRLGADERSIEVAQFRP
ncbi:MAG: hypothetical protein LC637_14290, partial [Xanthomonadaceae bacterium]|nr:hypothetical protein [Xanthomonadaceae bacterium]